MGWHQGASSATGRLGMEENNNNNKIRIKQYHSPARISSKHKIKRNHFKILNKKISFNFKEIMI